MWVKWDLNPETFSGVEAKVRTESIYRQGG
jgi:hypothetical protein